MIRRWFGGFFDARSSSTASDGVGGLKADRESRVRWA